MAMVSYSKQVLASSASHFESTRVPLAKCCVRPTRIGLAIRAHNPCVACCRVQQKVVLLFAVTNGHSDHIAQVASILIDCHAVRQTRIFRVDNVVCVLLTGAKGGRNAS